MRSRFGMLFSASGRRRVGALFAVLAAVAVVAGLVLRTGPAARPASTGPSDDASGTATVQRRDLVQTDTESGTVGHADPRTVYNRAHTKSEPFVLPTWALISAPAAGLAIGTIAGLYPAAKAARLSPTEALRTT